MKQLTVGEISVYSEDGESWDDLINVVRKASKAYTGLIREINDMDKEKGIRKFLKKMFF